MPERTTEQDLTISRATEAEFPLLEQLLQLYLHDFSEHADYDVDERGRFSYAWLDAYLEEPERHGYVIRVGARPAGFALVRAEDPVQMAEFEETVHADGTVEQRFTADGPARPCGNSAFCVT